MLVPKNFKKSTKISEKLNNIVSLFKDADEIEIIGNEDLNSCLQSIANITTNELNKANEEIAMNIWNKFKSL